LVGAPPRKGKLADEVTDWLRESILRGELAPGQHLLEEELADRLKVSRGPVRDAILQLEHEGLVLVRRHRGAFVARLSPEAAQEVHTLQLALERLAVESIVQKASDADWLAMQQVIKEMAQAQVGNVSQRQVADLDMRFHDLVFRAAHHERLLDFWSKLRSQVCILRLSLLADNPNWMEGHAEAHTLILDALRTRNRNLAVRILEDHLAREFQDQRK
jgi:DNA-binding GntR family transcriptional regulator